MKALKVIGIILLVIIAALLVIAAVLPKDVTLEESTVIKAPADKIFKQVDDFNIWPAWSPWGNELDSTTKYTYEGAEHGLGAIQKWKGEKAGEGTQTITAWDENKLIKTEIEFIGMGSAKSGWTFEESEDGTKVSWSFEMSDLKYPLGRIFGLMGKNSVKKDYIKGLANLKEYVESLPDEPKIETIEYKSEFGTHEIMLSSIESQNALAIRKMVTNETISEKLRDSYMKLMNYLKENDFEATGVPFSAWPNYDIQAEINELIAGIPVAEGITGEGEIENYTIPGGDVITIVHKGAYNEVMPAYMAAMDYMVKNMLVPMAESWESYITDPEIVIDTSEWITHIYFPVKQGSEEEVEQMKKMHEDMQ